MNDLISKESTESRKRKIDDDEKRKKSKSESQKITETQENQDENIEESNSDDEIDEKNINSYSQEVLCKDNLESEEIIKNGNFFLFFDFNIKMKI